MAYVCCPLSDEPGAVQAFGLIFGNVALAR